MNIGGELVEKFEYFRGNELSAASVEAPVNAQGRTSSQAHSNIEGGNGEEDVMTKEREEQVELWMQNVKAFIRQIDVSRL